ncbi:RICIN domain-containing protein [Saccharomonospora saliphila]|uniref:RICIN domain-containing protein n=1 Tax=Saccharomonospora saliphila TaxID=369829 RepID=UPI00048B9960|nr:RICIN domain-containing protein [Saccharomonospora saliphila]
MRRVLRGLTAVVFAVVCAGFHTTTAQAQDAPYEVLENQALKTMCIDDSNAYGLRMVSCNGMDYQKWYIDASWPNPYTETFYQNVVTHRCLDDSDYGLRVIACNGTVWQTWDPHEWGDGTWRLQNRATGRCLSTDHYGTVVARGCTTSEWQSWYRHF